MLYCLSLIKEEHGDLEIELLEKTEKHGTIPKDSYEVGVVTLDDRKFVDISNVW